MNAPQLDHDPTPQGNAAHVIGDTGPELWRRTIPAVFKDTVAAHGAREAAVFPEQGVRWTWSELDAEVDALAHAFRQLGLEKGDRVGIWAPNRYEWLLTQYATARVGIILVTINPAYRVTEVEYVLNKVGCAALVTADRFKTATISACCRTWRRSSPIANRGRSRRRNCRASAPSSAPGIRRPRAC